MPLPIAVGTPIKSRTEEMNPRFGFFIHVPPGVIALAPAKVLCALEPEGSLQLLDGLRREVVQHTRDDSGSAHSSNKGTEDGGEHAMRASLARAGAA